MRAISFLFVCLFSVGLGRRLQTTTEGSLHSVHESSRSAGDTNPSSVLACLFLGLNPAAGWQALGHTRPRLRLHSQSVGTPSVLVGHASAISSQQFCRDLESVQMSVLMSRDVDELLSENADMIRELRTVTAGAGEDIDDLWLLRFILDNPDDMAAAKAAAQSALEWRQGEGKPLIDAAKAAYAEATAGGGWNNKVIFEKAPNSAAIGKYMGPSGSEMITVPTSTGDLCQVIRASAIDDSAMMKEVSVQQLVDFFLYAKEVNSLVLNARARATKKLGQVVTATDLSGPGGMGQSKDFRTALGETSKKGASLFPLVNGPTILLNLPILLSFLVRLFKPLFPKKVQAKIKFENGPLKDVPDLKGLLEAGPRAKFVKEIEAIL